MSFTVAVDGPVAAGKGTIARALADRFGFAHLDTGALYRAVGVKGGDPVDAARGLTLKDLARDDLRTAAAGEAASKVATIPEVRAALLEWQRAFALRAAGAVLDGRDIGTVICPDADVKLYVTATAEVRAVRRLAEFRAADPSVTFAAVLEQVRARDARDMGRADAPLKPAADAVMLNTSALSIGAAVDEAISIVAARRG